MAAAKLVHSATLSGPSSRPRGILVETLQLVEPRKHPPVPNHLLDSKIYSKIAQNSVVQARPAAVHFAGFDLGKPQRQILQLGNVSTEVQRMHIIPPQTKYFEIKYTKGDRLVPGLTLDCVIDFSPDEWRYYYDCIRIHTPGEENLVIPIHAYPVMSTEEWPEHVNFPPIPVGHTSSRVIPLRCYAPIDFEFHLSILQHHPAFTVEPLSGVVPANGEMDVTVTFTPTEFSTAHMKVQLKISQFNAKPLVCNLMGSSIAGLAKQLTKVVENRSEQLLMGSRPISPLDRARSNKRKDTGKSGTRQSKSSDQNSMTSEEIEYAGIKFPPNLNTPYAVAQVLCQEPGKLRIKDLRDAIDAKKGNATAQSRQMKQAVFEMAVRQDVYEERQNQLRWQVKLGEDQIKPEARADILDNRNKAWQDYKMKRGDPVVDKEYLRTCTKCSFKRTRRDCADVAEDVAKFDTYSNDMWGVRHAAMFRLKQAAWKVLIRNRAEKKLSGLRDMVMNWGKQGFAFTENQDLKEKDNAAEEELEAMDPNILTPPRVKSISFPTYLAPNVKDDMAVDALGPVPYQPTEVIVKKKVPFRDLKVPQQYRLMGYKGHNTHEASQNYVPFGLMRELRSGAEDEVIDLPVPKLNLPPESQVEVEPEVKAETKKSEKEAETLSQQPSTVPEMQVQPLRPPQALFAPIDYPALHIFNPAPGLQVFQPPLPYAETDSDFHLCPLPRYTSSDTTNPHMSTQKKYLDREDVVRGVMGWKRFPSQGLTSLGNTPTLTNVWVPRWNDAFETDMMPHDLPGLQDKLSADDKDNIDPDDSDSDTVTLTPAMVNAQFQLIDVRPLTPIGQESRAVATTEKPTDKTTADKATDNKPITADKNVGRKDDMFPYGPRMPPTNIPVGLDGPVPKEKREQELEYFLKKKYNKLGTKFYTKTELLNSLKANEDLVLK